MANGNIGKAAAITYLLTVMTSINPRTTNLSDHVEPGIVDGGKPAPHRRSQQRELPAFACYFLFRPDGELTDLDPRLPRNAAIRICRSGAILTLAAKGEPNALPL